MGYRPTITKIDAFDATRGTTAYFTWKGNAAFANELIIRDNETNNIVYQYKTNRQMGLYHETNLVEGSTESFVNGRMYNATLIVYDKDDAPSDESDPVTFWCFSVPIFKITNDFTESGIVTMASLYLTFKYNQKEDEPLNEYTVMLYDSNNQLLHQSKTYNTSLSNGDLVYKIEGLQNTDGYKVCVEGKTVHGMKVSTGYVSFSIKFDKMGAGALVNLKDIGDGKISIGSNFKILDAKANPDPPKFINNEEVDLRKPGAYVEFDNGFVVDGNYECKIAFRAPAVGTLYTMKNAQGDTIRLSYEYYDIDYEDEVVRKYYFKLNVSGKSVNINIFSNMFDSLGSGRNVVVLIQHKNGYYNLKTKLSGTSSEDIYNITYYIDADNYITESIAGGEDISAYPAEKDSYDFIGWSTTSNASVEDIIEEGTVADQDIELYAVFGKNVKLTYYDNSTKEQVENGTIYYNNGNEEYPKFVMKQSPATTGMTARGWSTINKGDEDISYENGETIELTDDLTIYGLYQKEIVVIYYNGSTTASTDKKLRYWAPAGYIPAKFKLSQVSNGWTALGWSTETAANGTISYGNNVEFERDSNVTLYGMYSRKLTLSIYDDSTTPITKTDDQYYNSGKNVYLHPKFEDMYQTIKSGWSPAGWSTSSSVFEGLPYENGSDITISSNTSIYGVYVKDIYLRYNGNGASGSVSEDKKTRIYNSSGKYSNPKFTLKSNGFTAPVYSSFSQWAKGSALGTKYSAGASVELTEDTTFYAIWNYNGNTFTNTSIYVSSDNIVDWGGDAEVWRKPKYSVNGNRLSVDGIIKNCDYYIYGGTNATYNCTGASKCTINYSCSKGGANAKLTVAVTIGGKSTSFVCQDQTNGSVTLTGITGTTGMSYTAYWWINDGYTNEKTAWVQFDSIVLSN